MFVVVAYTTGFSIDCYLTMLSLFLSLDSGKPVAVLGGNYFHNSFMLPSKDHYFPIVSGNYIMPAQMLCIYFRRLTLVTTQCTNCVNLLS